MEADFLLVGLGNPGGEYGRSPHNAGFEVADRARALSKGPRFSVRGSAALSACRWRGHSILLLKPLTFMNRSGPEVAIWLKRTGLPLDRLMVCYDDLDLPFGRVRLRPGGGTGGHHGMESIVEHLGSGDFPRIRVGIEDPEISRGENVDYLLSPLSGERWALLEKSAQFAAEAALMAVAIGWSRAMNQYNRREVGEVNAPDAVPGKEM
jgi:peptidyl-tRNA hydrolase, PTH1 family